MSDTKHTNNIKMRYYIKGVLTLKSPMIIASGENEIADLQIVRDWGKNIFIPATTLAGNIRHLLSECDTKNLVTKYFGSADDKSGHSLFSFFDARAVKVSTDIRDGVKLENLTKTTEYGSKYDYEIINETSIFDFRMEVVVRNNSNINELEAVISKIIELLENCELRIGGKTSRGFGKIKLSDTKIQKIDLVKEQQKWINFSWEKLKGINKLEDKEGKKKELFKNRDVFKLSVCFAIPDSLIIKSYSADPNDVDSVSLTSNGKPIISGTSWNGAIRHALENAGRELNKHQEMLKLIRETFGWVDDRGQSKNAIPSKVIIDESKIFGGKMLPYVRNKVDRFTGGVVNSALFDEKPVYGGMVTLNCELRNPEDYEIGMLLLAIKELQNGIQTVGGGSNIGRGRLEKGPFKMPDKQQEYLDALAKKLSE